VADAVEKRFQWRTIGLRFDLLNQVQNTKKKRAGRAKTAPTAKRTLTPSLNSQGSVFGLSLSSTENQYDL